MNLEALTAPKKARVEIIPLIDVIFFLLATFVLFTLSLNRIAVIEPIFPQPSPISGEDDTVKIQASAGGTYYWKQGVLAPELISAKELEPRLVDYRRHSSNPRVMVRGDDKARFGEAIAVFDAARRSGIRAVSLETLVGRTGN
jgi:biopolymer transport protein ExbD